MDKTTTNFTSMKKENANQSTRGESFLVDCEVILQLTEKLKTSEIENELQKYLEDKQIYDNYKRSFMLPDDAEIVASYVGIFIRTMLVDIKSKLSK